MKAGVDIGGTKIAVCLSDGSAAGARPRILAQQTEPTTKTGTSDAVAQQVIRMLGELCQKNGLADTGLQAVGVASCGPFVLRGGLVELAAPNICGGMAGAARGLPNDWRTALLEAPLRQRYAQVRIENDAVAALEAERRWGALRGAMHCAYVTWSTGVGIGLCVDGHVLRGKNGNAGHAGHTFVSDDASGALCGCGNRGDVEALVSGHAMAGRFGMDGRALLEAAQAGETHAVMAVDELCRTLGRMLYNLVVTLDLERISIGGSVFLHHSEWLRPRLLMQVLGRLPALTEGFELVPAGLGAEVGDYAALALVS